MAGIEDLDIFFLQGRDDRIRVLDMDLCLDFKALFLAGAAIAISFERTDFSRSMRKASILLHRPGLLQEDFFINCQQLPFCMSHWPFTNTSLMSVDFAA